MTYIDNSITVLFWTFFFEMTIDIDNIDTTDDADAHYHHKYHSYNNPGYSTSTKLIWKVKTKYEIITQQNLFQKKWWTGNMKDTKMHVSYSLLD